MSAGDDDDHVLQAALALSLARGEKGEQEPMKDAEADTPNAVQTDSNLAYLMAMGLAPEESIKALDTANSNGIEAATNWYVFCPPPLPLLPSHSS